MKVNDLKQNPESVNRFILIFISICIAMGLFLFIFMKYPFDLIFASISTIMALVHLGLLIKTNKSSYLAPIGFYLFVALTFFFIFFGINPLITAVLAGLFFINFIYILITRKFT